MTNHRALRLLRSTLAHIDSAMHALQLAADAAHQNDNQSLVKLLEAKGDELLAIRTRIENDLRDLEAQAVNQTKGQEA
jgi:septum formation inhibitor MinC